MSRPRSFSERFPDRARSGSSSNLIAGELTEARRLVPRRVDLRDSERVERSLFYAGLEPAPPLPRRTVRAHLAEHWGKYVAWGVGGAMLCGFGAFLGFPWWQPWWTVLMLLYMLVGGTLSGV